MCHISGLLFSQSSRQQSLWLPRGQKLFLSGQMEKLANISKPHVKKRKLKLLLAGFPFQRVFFYFCGGQRVIIYFLLWIPAVDHNPNTERHLYMLGGKKIT